MNACSSSEMHHLCRTNIYMGLARSLARYDSLETTTSCLALKRRPTQHAQDSSARFTRIHVKMQSRADSCHDGRISVCHSKKKEAPYAYVLRPEKQHNPYHTYIAKRPFLSSWSLSLSTSACDLSCVVPTDSSMTEGGRKGGRVMFCNETLLAR